MLHIDTGTALYDLPSGSYRVIEGKATSCFKSFRTVSPKQHNTLNLILMVKFAYIGLKDLSLIARKKTFGYLGGA